MEMGVPLCGVIPPVKAKTPCSVYEPLIESGIIPDPYFELNSRLCEWVAARFWVYETNFTIDNFNKNKRYRLVFEGLDCKCEIWLNKVKIAESDNMYVPVKVDVTDLLNINGENALKVMFYHAPDEMGQIGYTSKVLTQKARFSYKWDFSCRLPQIGIYRPVYLEEYTVLIENLDVRTDKEGNFSISANTSYADGKTVSVSIYDGDKKVFNTNKTIQDDKFNINGTVENVKIWYCNTYGDANLYDAVIEITDGGEVLFKQNLRLGFKTLQVVANEGASADAPNYLFVLNGKKTYIKGANLAPFDMLYGRITNEKIKYVVDSLKEMNVNLARVWGGGFIENEYFYDLCDKAGIMVWQDFIQSSSGIDNHPSAEDGFIQKFMDTVKCAVNEKRNHVCTAIFCGGNEIAVGEARTPVDETEKLTGLVGEYVRANSSVHFVATTPCGKNFAADWDHPENNHDVHAPWLYLGDVEHYKYGNRLQCLFHGEFGANGMSDISSLRKFLSEENIGVFNFQDNYVWRHHGELWDTYFRDKAIFGEGISTVEDMIETSQFIQAEAVRYLIESNRRRSFANGGTMFWCFNEPFPNVSNTCFMDYYGVKKSVYYAIKHCYDNAYASIIYDKLAWNVGEEISVKPYLICEKGDFSCKVSVFADENIVLEKTFNGCNAETDKATYFDEINFVVPKANGLRFTFEVTVGGKQYYNAVQLLVKNENGFASIASVKDFNKVLNQTF